MKKFTKNTKNTNTNIKKRSFSDNDGESSNSNIDNKNHYIKKKSELLTKQKTVLKERISILSQHIATLKKKGETATPAAAPVLPPPVSLPPAALTQQSSYGANRKNAETPTLNQDRKQSKRNKHSNGLPYNRLQHWCQSVRSPGYHENLHHKLTNLKISNCCVQNIPRVPYNQEHLLHITVQSQLAEARIIGEIQNIPPQQIWVHEELMEIWYNSFDVGKVISQVIPRAVSSGFPRSDEFSAPLLPPHAPTLNIHGFENWETFIEDMTPFTKDPTLLTNIRCGFPQSYCGPFRKMVYRNLPMTDHGKQKVRDNHDKQIEGGKCSLRLPSTEMDKIMPIYVSLPEGVIPKNSSEKTKLLLNPSLSLKDINTRTILHVSKQDKQGRSVNSQTSEETLHSVQFVRVKDIEEKLLEARSRLREIGFEDWTNRILLYKCDITSAYRIMMSAVADHFLGVHGIDGKFIIEYAQQFGQKSSVTIFHRFVYAITSLFSQPGFADKHFPEMALEKQENQEDFLERPSIDTIRKELQRFKDGDENGTMDPAVFLYISWYLDDFMGIVIDVRNDISTPLKPDADGIRNPIGKALNFFLKRWGVPQNLKKRREENDMLLMGNQFPIILGIQFDIKNMHLFVRADYAKDLAIRLERWVLETNRQNHPAEEWGLIQGRLGFATIVYPNFKCFMREIWHTYARILNNNATAWCPCQDILDNMKIMAVALRRNRGRQMIHNDNWRHAIQKGLHFACDTRDSSEQETGTHHIMHDASTNYGFGFVNVKSGEYYFRKYKPGHEQNLARNKKIFVLEAIGMFIAFFVNQLYLADSKINLIGDNLGLVASFHWCGSSSNNIVNSIIRQFVLLLSSRGIELNCDRTLMTSWCDTIEMEPADALSRNDIESFERWTNTHFPNIQFKKLDENDARIREAERSMNVILDKYCK